MYTQKVSIIIPVYNVQTYIEECLKSLLQQTYKNLEIILVNDGSTDNSGIICDKYAEADTRIRVFHKENGGVSSARNVGLQNVTGDYVTFVDPDDWIEPDMYEKMVMHFDNNIEAVFCGYWESPEKEMNLSPILHQPEKEGIVNGEEALYQCMIGIGYGYFTSVWNKMFRTSFLKEYSIFFENYSIAEDELWLAKLVPLCDKVYLLPTPFYHWRQRGDSACHKEVVDDRWYEALETKLKTAEILKQTTKHVDLAYGKVYSDLFHCIWIGHCSGSKHDEKYFRNALKDYRAHFWASQEFSVWKKLRFLTLDWMCLAYLPKSWTQKLGNSTRIKIRNRKRT